MPLLSAEVEFITRYITSKLKWGKKEYEVIKSALEKVQKEEEEIEKEARNLLEKHIKDAEEIDTSKALDMIKKKLAEKRGVVL